MNFKMLSGTLIASSLLLAACGDTEEKEASKADDKETTETAEKVTTEAPAEEKETTVLKDDTAVLEDIDVKILESKFLPKGTYENQSADQLVVTYEITNKSDKEIDPMTGYLAVFEAYQDDENSKRKLNVGMTPMMDEYKFVLDNQMDIIKKDGTVKSAIAYDLEDTETPVELVANKGIRGEKLGSKLIKLK